MIGSLKAELLKLRKRRAIWVTSAIIPLSIVLAYGVGFLILRGFGGDNIIVEGDVNDFRDSFLPENALNLTTGTVGVIGAGMALIVGALAAGNEYGWATLKTILSQGPSRMAVFGGKLAALALVFLVVGLITLIVAILASLGFASIEGVGIDWFPVLDALQAVGVIWLVLMVWACLGLMLAVMLRETTFAVGAGLVYLLLIENAIIGGLAGVLNLFRTIQKVLPGTGTSALSSVFGGGSGLIEPLPALGLVVVYLVLFIGASAAVFQRRDVA